METPARPASESGRPSLAWITEDGTGSGIAGMEVRVIVGTTARTGTAVWFPGFFAEVHSPYCVQP